MNNNAFSKRKLLSVAELHEYTGWPIASIYSKKCRGLLPKDSIVKLPDSNLLFFDKEAIDRFIEDCKPYK